MGGNSEKKLPTFESTQKLVEFFEGNDMGEYQDELPEVYFQVDLRQSSHLVEVDDDVAERIAEISKQEHVPSDSLINTWLREKLSNYSEKR